MTFDADLDEEGSFGTPVPWPRHVVSISDSILSVPRGSVTAVSPIVRCHGRPSWHDVHVSPSHELLYVLQSSSEPRHSCAWPEPIWDPLPHTLPKNTPLPAIRNAREKDTSEMLPENTANTPDPVCLRFCTSQPCYWQTYQRVAYLERIPEVLPVKHPTDIALLL